MDALKHCKYLRDDVVDVTDLMLKLASSQGRVSEFFSERDSVDADLIRGSEDLVLTLRRANGGAMRRGFEKPVGVRFTGQFFTTVARAIELEDEYGYLFMCCGVYRIWCYFKLGVLKK